MYETSKTAVRNLCKQIAEELGLPYVENNDLVPNETCVHVRFSHSSKGRWYARCLFSGYLMRVQDDVKVVAPRLLDMLDGIRATKSAIRSGRIKDYKYDFDIGRAEIEVVSDTAQTRIEALNPREEMRQKILAGKATADERQAFVSLCESEREYDEKEERGLI